MDAYLSAATDAAAAVVGTVGSAVQLNYIVGEKVFQAITVAASLVASCVSNLVLLVTVVLQDLLHFCHDLIESFQDICFLLQSCWVKGVASASYCLHNISQAISSTAKTVHVGYSLLRTAILDGVGAIGSFLYVLGSSITLLFNLIPRTFYLIYLGVISLCQRIVHDAKYVFNATLGAIYSAPLEIFLGLFAVVALLFGLNRLSKRYRLRTKFHHMALKTISFIQSVRIADVIRLIITPLLLVYVGTVRCIITVTMTFIKVTMMALVSAHTPRFHHVGDSDAEDDEDNRGLVGPVDSSDDESNTLRLQKQQTYDRILKKRQERQKNKAHHSEQDSDVEELLFEQMEREREDKLCVICQDREKCIMILPCRHLCVCSPCQDRMIRQRRQQRASPNRSPFGSCPICRKEVKQTIKAYL